jgi:hypothetical protein
VAPRAANAGAVAPKVQRFGAPGKLPHDRLAFPAPDTDSVAPTTERSPMIEIDRRERDVIRKVPSLARTDNEAAFALDSRSVCAGLLARVEVVA